MVGEEKETEGIEGQDMNKFSRTRKRTGKRVAGKAFHRAMAGIGRRAGRARAICGHFSVASRAWGKHPVAFPKGEFIFDFSFRT